MCHWDVCAKTVFKFRDAQARAGDAVTEVCVKPTVVEVKILEEKGRIKDVWTLSREEVEVAMKGELDNIRAWGTYLSTIKNDCDVIMGATFKIEDDEKSGGYTVTVVVIRACSPTGILPRQKITNGYVSRNFRVPMIEPK